VVVVDRDKALAQRTVEMIKEAKGAEAIALDADVTQARECARMVQAALDTFGRLDLLDNNVGIGSRGSVVDEPEENWRRVMQVNVETMFLASKHVIPAMRKAGGGAIVNVSSISAIRPRGLTVYTVSKSAVIGLTKAMAVDHGKEGIRVNCVAPGPVYTPMVYGRGMSPAARETRKNASALKVEGTGWDIGAAVRFLLSEQARYITGQVLVVDGGTSLTAPDRDSQ
jgi:NAD(P)-dependent dehydrogenase (short-subunit alcohol dehydrogenase family)